MSRISRETRNRLTQRIRKLASEGRVVFRHHARIKMRDRGIYINDILDILLHGEVIEVYPRRKPYPGCLLYHKVGGRPLHAACTLPRGKVVVVTVYEPDASRWVDFRTRRT
ncbi:MAG: DUF4258 domain-containing protein [Euryarchaeota archaeon]|nr:DUF4258 domain-containing protein [Euryarchaeota archaeon]